LVPIKCQTPLSEAPDDSLNTIPLGGSDDGSGVGVDNSNGGDLQGILSNSNDFGGDSTAENVFPIQDNQESPELGIPDLNSKHSSSLTHENLPLLYTHS